MKSVVSMLSLILVAGLSVSTARGTIVYSEPFTNANDDGWVNVVANPYATTAAYGDGFYTWPASYLNDSHGKAYYAYSDSRSSGYVGAQDGNISEATPLAVSAAGNQITISMDILDWNGTQMLRDVAVVGKYADGSDAWFGFTYATSGAAQTWQTVSQAFALPQNLARITRVAIGAQLNAWDYLLADNIQVAITPEPATLILLGLGSLLLGRRKK